jgi:two-component system, OmpR family, sensor histidine kinase SenX3
MFVAAGLPGPPAALPSELVDVTTAIAIGAVFVAAVVAVFALIRLSRQSRSIDDAVGRLGGTRPAKRRHRRRALVAALDDLERALAMAQRDRARLAGAVHTAPLGIVITDDAGVVVTTNPEAGRFLGSHLGEAVAEVRVRRAIDEAILGRRAVETEVELYTPVRSVVEVTAIPLDFGVESVGAVAFILDVTEGRRVAAMRRDFIANVSHELKTPLAALAVLAETLAAGADPGTTAKFAGRVEAEAHRLSALVDDILDLSQAEAAEVHHRPVALGSVVAEAVASVAEVAAEHGVELVTEPVPLEAVVSGDQRQLRIMLANLVENAVEYSIPAVEGGGTPPVVRTGVSVDGDRIRIRVEDSGIGISEAHLDRIFERFYRVDRARSRDSGGTGLGLSIVRHIARSHRGEVTVRSVEGEGSTFTVELPLWKPA